MLLAACTTLSFQLERMIIIKYPVKLSRMIHKYLQNLRDLAEKQYMQNLSAGKLLLSKMIQLYRLYICLRLKLTHWKEFWKVKPLIGSWIYALLFWREKSCYSYGFSQKMVLLPYSYCTIKLCANYQMVTSGVLCWEETMPFWLVFMLRD